MATKGLPDLAGAVQLTAETKQLLIVAAIGIAAVWLLGKTRLMGTLAEGLAQGAVGAAGGVVTGTVKGVGEVFGVPDTDDDQCTIDLANGDMWSASFSCPAKRYFNVAVMGKTDLQAEALKFRRAEGA